MDRVMGMGAAGTSAQAAGMGAMSGATSSTPPAPDLTGPIPHPMHGGWLGHMLPGWFFLAWATWWFVGNFRLYLKASSRHPYVGRSWYEFAPFPPLEPWLKVALTFIGINGELWFGHESFRHLVGPDGRFIVGNINEWQHSAMYAAFMLSGAVDLAAHYSPPGLLPDGTQHACLAAAFVVEGLLFAFHLEGSQLNWQMHLLLVFCILGAAGAALGELRFRGSFLLATLRALLVALQGAWFCTIARVLFEDHPAWDPRYHGSAMLMPVMFCALLMALVALVFTVFVGLRLWQLQAAGGVAYWPAKREEGLNGSVAGGDVEAVPLTGRTVVNGRTHHAA